MEKITDQHPDSASLDIVQDNISKLKQLFPELITEDAEGAKIDTDVLKELVGQQVIDGDKERYNFTWHGKAAARRLAQTPSTGTLRPCKEESKDWDTTQNLFIEGDNLEVLKLLQKSYHKKVKMIYIDPPYNTGKDFVYKDSFKDSLKNYKALTNQIDNEGNPLSSNPENSGRYHSSWLSMIYPRLKQARNLLVKDGFIAVSIDDDEYHNLIQLMNDVFGENNYIATLCWDKNRKNDAKFFSVGHEYMAIYAKDLNHLKELKTVLREDKEGIETARDIYNKIIDKYESYEKQQEEWRKYFRNISSDSPLKQLGRFNKINSRGPYRDDGDISWPGGNGPKFDVIHPTTKKVCKTPKGGWVYSTIERFMEEVESGRVVFGDDETTLPRQCRYLFESDGQVMTSMHYSYAQTATMDFVDLMGARVFDNPKNWKDIKRITQYFCTENDIVLDFFAGSGSTAHAVLDINASKNSNIRFVLVQLPEECPEKSVAYKQGFKKISEITIERIKKAGDKILTEHNDKNIDTGFKIFKLDSSNVKSWDANFDNLEQSLFNADDSLKQDRSAEDVLYEILLKYGLDLTLPIEEHTLSGKTVYNIGFGALMICLDNEINMNVVDAIGELNKELQPEVMRVVFKDAGFDNDVVKTNAIQVLKQFGIDDVKSI